MSATHEYGHFLANRYAPEVTVVNDARKRKAPAETFADGFARIFLMPSSGMIRRFESLRRASQKPLTAADLLQLCHLYGVSFQALTLRLEELHLVDSGTWDRLADMGFRPDKAKRLLGLEDRAANWFGMPRRYVALLVRAYVQGELSEGQLAERLGTDRVRARALVDELTFQMVGDTDGSWHQAPLDLSAVLNHA